MMNDLTTFPIHGLSVPDLPDLGVVNDGSQLVGERAGTGRFAAPALATYVAGYINANIHTVPLEVLSNIAALRSNSQAKGAANPFYVSGYYSIADGGEGLFFHVAADTTSADNHGTIIVDVMGQRWHRATTQAEPYNVLWFGAVGDGATDNLAAFQQAIRAADLDVSSPVLYVPRGKYALSAALAYTFAGPTTALTIRGDGAEASCLLWPNGTDGLAVTFTARTNSIHLNGLSFLGGGVNLGTAVSLTGAFTTGNPGLTAGSEITNCTFRGSDGFAETDCWNKAISVVEVSTINVDGCVFTGSATLQGDGFTCTGTPTQFVATVNFTGTYFYNMNTAVTFGDNTQAVILSQCTILNTTGGVVVPPLLSNLDELQIIGCDISCVGACVSLGTAVPTFMVTGSFIQVPVNAAGLFLDKHNLFSITGNVFSGEPAGGVGQIGILAVQTVGPVGGVIVGNAFYGLADTAIQLGASTTNITIAANMYNTVAAQIGDAGTGNSIAGGYESHSDVTPVNMVLGSGSSSTINAGLTLRDRSVDQWHIYKGTDNHLRITNIVAGADAIEINPSNNIVNCPQGVMVNFGANWLAGTVAPTHVAPIGSLFSLTNGVVGATLYVSRGAGVWAAVAGV